jgi:hypothetical protein
MKLPVNPDVVRVCIKFYAYLKKVQVEALKALLRFKKEVKEYVRLIAPWLARPVQESLRLPLVKTPEDRWKEAVKIWPWQLVFLEQFLSGAPRLSPISSALKREAPLYTPFGTPVIYGATMRAHDGSIQGAGATIWS